MSSNGKNKAVALRRRAEKLLNESPETYKVSELQDVNKLAHELAVHQAELELQHEELRNTQLILQKTRDRFAALFEHAPVGYVVLDDAGMIRQTNSTWGDMLGRPGEEFRGKPFSEFILKEDAPIHHPDDLERVTKWLNDCIESGSDQLEPNEYRLVKKDGQVITVHALGVIERDKENVKVFATLQDITEQKHAEEALRKSEEKHRITLNSIGDAVIATDVKSRIIHMNPVARDLTGWELKEALGQDLRTVFNIQNAKTGKRVKNPVEPVLKSGNIIGLANHTKLVSKDGQEYQIADSGAPIKNATGEITGVVLVFRDVSKEYQMREALREREQRFRSVFETANVGKCITQPDGQVFFNKAFCEMLGYTKEELRDKTWQELTPDADIEKSTTQIAPLLNGEKDSARFEKRYLDKNGSIIWADVSTVLHRDDQGDPQFFITTVIDISERKQMEDALRQNEQNLKEAQRLAKIGSWLWYFDSDELYLSDEMYNIMGAKKDKILLRVDQHKRYYTPESWQRFQKAVETAKKTGEPYEIELELIRKKGENRYTVARGEPVFDHEKVIGLRGTLQDITEHKKTDQIIKENERKFRTLVEQIADGLLLHDLDGKILAVNQTSVNQYGYSRDELLNMNVSDIDPDYDEREEKGAFYDQMNFNDPVRFEARQQRKDAEIFPAEVTLTKIRLQDQVYIMGLCRDISQRKKAENELRTLKDRLEQEVEKKTKELQQRLQELERFHDATIEREFRMKELRDENDELREKIKDIQ
ncbi:MAG: PAS domain S-box protein [candidate division KSB1 bacterium]|nr:PAS domain S-box protein [candidate division KSB1 bacterium]